MDRLQDLYHKWVAFGTGGTPPTLGGYVRITNFRIKRFLTFDDLKDASKLTNKGPGYIKTPLPKRDGSPPKIVSRTLPQRQYSEPLDANIKKHLHSIPQSYTAKYPEILRLEPSITEGGTTDAIYAHPTLSTRKDGAKDRILGHEIAHVHPAENSLHVWLTEADCKKVVSAGRGERFPLSSLGMVHQGLTFVYAPRTTAQVEVIEKIVETGIQNVTGAALPVLDG